MRWLRIVAVLIAGAALFSPKDANSCGPWFPEYEFTPLHGPIDRPAFASGQLGVVRPHFYRESLLIAYRQLVGVPLTAEEVAAVTAPPDAPRGPFVMPSGETAVTRWLAARGRVPGAAKVESIEQYKKLPGKDEYEQFPNCLDDAFDTAASTLADRQRTWGAGPKLAEWLRAQDQVFGNCSGGPSIPAPTAAGSDKLLAADRQYQIAAAEFYALRFADAERDFEAVGANAASPWRDAGPYLAARAMIREGTLLNRPEKLREAEARLKALGPGRFQASARGLADFVHASIDPKQRLVELGTELTKPGLGPKLRQVITDYTHISDRITEFPTSQSELADWIVSFQTGAQPQHMIERWRAQQGRPWLLASLVWADPRNAVVPDLIAAARKLPSTDPAFPTATYYGIRLQIARGEADAAREWTDAALATKQSDAVTNLLRAERLRLARDWDDFLRYATRKPVGLTIGMGDDDPPASDQFTKVKPNSVEADFTSPMNRLTPLGLWIQAANSTVLPRDLQADIAQAGWIRAALLDNADAARTLAVRARELRPALGEPVRAYLADRTGFTAAFWILRTPGLSPEMRSGLGRTTALDRIDNVRDNWWSLGVIDGAPERDRNHQPLYDLYAAGPVGPTDFLPAAQRAEGEKEAARLQETAANAVDYLCAAVLEWAKSHPRDPRVPEALHLAVRATRYGVADNASHGFSKQAFELLHRDYPNTEWAKNTKYWY
jgi:hypothetical protein